MARKVRTYPHRLARHSSLLPPRRLRPRPTSRHPWPFSPSRPLKSSIIRLKLDTLWWTEWKRRIESQLQLATKLSADSAPIHRLLTTRKSGEQREAPSLPSFIPSQSSGLHPSFRRSQRNSATEIHISLETTKNKRRGGLREGEWRGRRERFYLSHVPPIMSSRRSHGRTGQEAHSVDILRFYFPCKHSASGPICNFPQLLILSGVLPLAWGIFVVKLILCH